MTYEQIVISDNPAAWWKLSEQSGNIAYDSSGNGQNGTIGTGVQLAQPSLLLADPGYSVRLATGGIASQSIQVPGPSLGTSWSWEMWFEADSGLPATYHWLLRWNDSFPSVYLNPQQSFIMSSGVNTVGSVNNYSDGNPHHGVVTYDGNYQSVYVDGHFYSKNIPNPSTSMNLTPATLYISNGAWIGQLSNIVLYPYPLSPNQVAAHFQAGSGATLLGNGGASAGVGIGSLVRIWRIPFSSGEALSTGSAIDTRIRRINTIGASTSAGHSKAIVSWHTRAQGVAHSAGTAQDMLFRPVHATGAVNSVGHASLGTIFPIKSSGTAHGVGAISDTRIRPIHAGGMSIAIGNAKALVKWHVKSLGESHATGLSRDMLIRSIRSAGSGTATGHAVLRTIFPQHATGSASSAGRARLVTVWPLRAVGGPRGLGNSRVVLRYPLNAVGGSTGSGESHSSLLLVVAALGFIDGEGTAEARWVQPGAPGLTEAFAMVPHCCGTFKLLPYSSGVEYWSPFTVEANLEVV